MKRVIVATLCLMSIGGLSGCSTSGAMTCAEYGELSQADRDSALDDLLTENRLDDSALGNTLGVVAAVDNYCGTTTSMLFDPEPATSNVDSAIENAVDWESESW